MVRAQQAKQIFQVVGAWDSQAEFDQERLQEFLRGLLRTALSENSIAGANQTAN
jgi:hypothetical protein